jgi:hypothetical protein
LPHENDTITSSSSLHDSAERIGELIVYDTELFNPLGFQAGFLLSFGFLIQTLPKVRLQK